MIESNKKLIRLNYGRQLNKLIIDLILINVIFLE